MARIPRSKAPCAAVLIVTTAALLLLFYYQLYTYPPFEPTAKFRPILSRESKDPSLKYIYQLTSPNTLPFKFMERGQSVFIKNNCTYQNCFVTSERDLLGDVRLFDAVLLHAPELWAVGPSPPRRHDQKYVFVSTESAHYYPVKEHRWDGYFNWTWTYRLDSDVPFPYVSVRDETGRLVAPARLVAWRPRALMRPVPAPLRAALSRKRVAAAWLVSNCNARSQRNLFVKQLQQELGKFGLRVDVWGRCGRAAPDPARLQRLLQTTYYFYLALENSFSDDYVTEKLLHATGNFAVPVVFGSADYSRFLPPESFLDGCALGPAGTARRMRDLIADPPQYAEYHRWRSHYTYHNSDAAPDTNPHCRFCEMMNSDHYRLTTIYKDLRGWWNGSISGTCLKELPTAH